MRTGVTAAIVAALALLFAHGASGHHDPVPDSHIGHYHYLLETLEVRLTKAHNPLVLPNVPLNVLLDVKVRVSTHDNQRSLFIFNYTKSDYQKYSFGDVVYRHEDCTPEERPVYFYARAVLMPRTVELPAGLKQGALAAPTNESSWEQQQLVEKLFSGSQTIPLGTYDYKVDPDVHHDHLIRAFKGGAVEYTVRPAYIVDGKRCNAKKLPGTCTVTGSGTIKGTPGDDVICGGPRDDICVGGGGNDTCKLGGGNNTCTLGQGNDTCVTGPGNDVCTGGPGEDTSGAFARRTPRRVDFRSRCGMARRSTADASCCTPSRAWATPCSSCAMRRWSASAAAS